MQTNEALSLKSQASPEAAARAAATVESFLKPIGVRFAIELPDGSTVGDLEVVRPKKRTRVQKVPQGFWQSHFLRFVEGQRPGEDRMIPPPDGYLVADIRSPVSAHCSRAWGKKTFRTRVDDALGVVIVSRFA